MFYNMRIYFVLTEISAIFVFRKEKFENEEFSNFSVVRHHTQLYRMDGMGYCRSRIPVLCCLLAVCNYQGRNQV